LLLSFFIEQQSNNDKNIFKIQDFRFLCPNGTAFDQEAQICADWGDVDCEAATLYYGSDNFDLYRIGSNFESKRTTMRKRMKFSICNALKQVCINNLNA
jgi:Chitin binding Peritrophin-A domain